MKALVSIIIPIYNVSKYMDECIRSACDQDYENLEIILVDDGSTDDSGEKCNTWAKQDSRIQTIHKRNGGLSSARNAGLDIAKGTYVYFLDGDDSIEKNLISTAVRFMDTGEDIIFFCHYKIFANGEKIPVDHETGRYQLNSGEQRAHFLTDYILSGRLGWEAWNKLYRRALIEKYNLRFADNNIIFAEDLYFCLCYCSHATKVISIRKYLYNYMQRSDSIMSEQSTKLNIGRMNELSKEVLGFLKQFDDCNTLIEHFPIIHFMIMDNVLTRIRNNFKLSPPEFRRIVYGDIQDVFFWRKWTGEFLKKKKELYKIYLGSKAAVKISYVRFLYDGNYLLLRMRNRIINRNWAVLNQINSVQQEWKEQIKTFSKNNKCIYYIGSEEYGNLGDNEIAEAIMKFSRYYFPDYHLLEVTCKDFQKAKPYLQKYIKSKDVIFLTGGGNFGNAYPLSDNIREEIITGWKNNIKIVFPQTIDFLHNEDGDTWLQKAQRVYSKENNVIIFTREKYSFQIAKKYFQCSSYLAPDIVLFCNEQQCVKREELVLFCFRDDKEKYISETVKESVKKAVIKTNYEIKQIDLQLPYDVRKFQRKEEIKKKMDDMRKSSLVITDRLHGMVFAVITGTPCIVFSNYNHKVKGTYEWISYLPYVKYIENEEEAIAWIPKLIKMQGCKYDNTPLLPYYDQLAQVVKENGKN